MYSLIVCVYKKKFLRFVDAIQQYTFGRCCADEWTDSFRLKQPHTMQSNSTSSVLKLAPTQTFLLLLLHRSAFGNGSLKRSHSHHIHICTSTEARSIERTYARAHTMTWYGEAYTWRNHSQCKFRIYHTPHTFASICSEFIPLYLYSQCVSSFRIVFSFFIYLFTFVWNNVNLRHFSQSKPKLRMNIENAATESIFTNHLHTRPRLFCH